MVHVLTREEFDLAEEPGSALFLKLVETVAIELCPDGERDSIAEEIRAVFRGECEPVPDGDAEWRMEDAERIVEKLIDLGVISVPDGFTETLTL